MVEPALVARAVEVLARAPAGLLTDIDGTISPIAPTPEAATVAPGVAATLERLAGRLAVVAAITGRAAADAARLVGAPRLLYVGNHGLEWLRGGRLEVAAAARPYVPRIAATLAAVERAAGRAGLRGLVFEDKGVTASIHYRLAPDPDRAHDVLEPLVRDLAAEAGLRVTEGRRILELRPPVPGDKGTALAGVIAAHGLAGVVFLGDDLTDLDAMAELRRQREAGRVAGLNVGVADAPPAVRAQADALAPDVAGVAALLAAVAERLCDVERGA
ncbi:MAG TPA: trehalose-phosphatase [Thermomicrobiales bacterium]|nr:trehalose-phosphatase [Thermomicrobiales bacterium]